tara:strand:- start:1358 stop:1549 length:192 start_codon:yes stop_codon:yes gene_type:complete
MKNREDIEEMIADSITLLLERSSILSYKDKQAISQEYKEWLYGIAKEEDIWVISNFKSQENSN